MSFAKPIAKAPGNSTRGRPGSSSVNKAPAEPKPRPKATRASSVSSTSSARSSHSKLSAQDDAMSIPDEADLNSRPPSVFSNSSASDSVGGPEAHVLSPPNFKPQISTAPTISPDNTIQPEPSLSSAPQPTTDSLQVAAQVYPWLYMTSTLEACFKSAETAAEKDLATRTNELSEEESDVSDQRARLEAERKVEFYEELSTDKFANTVPSVMQSFLSHGDACTLLEGEALQLATLIPSLAEDDYSPMKPYNAMLDKLEALQRENAQLHASIVALTEEDDGMDTGGEEFDQQPSARSQIINVFSACLPVLQARAANLQMAHELLEGAKENLAMSLHLQSLEFSESDGE